MFVDLDIFYPSRWSGRNDCVKCWAPRSPQPFNWWGNFSSSHFWLLVSQRDSHHTCRHPSSRLTLISPKIYTYSSLLQVYNKHSVLHTRIHLWASLLISLHALTDWIGPAIGMDYVYATSLLLIAGPALDRLVAVTSQIEKKEKKENLAGYRVV